MLYISGKITDESKEKESANIDLFFQEEIKLIYQGYEVINPAAVVINEGTWEDYLAYDLHLIVTFRPTIWLLPNWKESRGARLEVAFAEKLGLQVVNK